MTSQPFAPPRLLTVAEYLELGETESGYDELVEGRVVTSPSPIPVHNIAGSRTWRSIDDQLPPGLAAVQDVDIDLQLSRADRPGFTRRPDLIVVRRAALARVATEGGVLRASEVLVAMEIVSPGSERTDNVIKRAEYADAAIPHYWIIDITPPVSLIACHLAGEFGYADGGAVTGVFTATAPFAVEIDLDTLT